MSKIPLAKLLLWSPDSRLFFAVKEQGHWMLPETLSVGSSVVHTLTEYVEKTLAYVIPGHWISLSDDKIYRYDNTTVLRVDVPRKDIPEGDDQKWFSVENWQRYGGVNTREVLSTLHYFGITGKHMTNPHVRTQLCGLFLANLPANAETLALYRDYTSVVIDEARLNLRLYRGVLPTWKSALIQPPRRESGEWVWEIDSWRLRVTEGKWSVEFHHALTPEQAVQEYRSCLGYLNRALDNLGIPSL